MVAVKRKQVETGPKPWIPHAYQKKAVRFLLEQACAGLFLDPGLGKTSIVLAAIKVLLQQGLLDRALIIAPMRVMHSVWPREAQDWADFNHLRLEILHGDGKAKALARKAHIYLINPEGLPWLMSGGRFKALNADTLVIDESSKFKHTNTQRFKMLKPVLRKFARRWILTGSPAPNGLMDVFGQIYILDLGHALGEFITKYRLNYFVQSGFGGYTWNLRKGADKEIHARIRPLVLRMDAEDHLDMPEVIHNNIWIDLPSKVRRIYNDLEEDLIAELSGKEKVTAATAAAASVKCRQVANGGIYRTLEPGEKPKVNSDRWANLHMEKVDAILSLVDELGGQPLLVAYDFEHDLDRLRLTFGKDVPYIGGGVPRKRALDLEREWNLGNLPVLLGHPASIAHGLNLQGAGHHVAFHSMTWDYELYDQFVRRVRRQGQKAKRVFVHHIMARNTIDEAMLASLQGKSRVQGAFLDALKSYLKRK